MSLFIGLSFTLAYVLRLRRAQTAAQVRAETTFGGSQRVLIVASSLLLLVAGIYMTVTAWDSDPPWILLSLAALVVMGVLGGVVSARRLEAIKKAAEASGDSLSPALKRQLADPVLLTAVLTAGMLGLGVVFLMTTKPDLIGSLIALAVALVLGVVSAQVWRRPAEARARVEEAAPGV